MANGLCMIVLTEGLRYCPEDNRTRFHRHNISHDLLLEMCTCHE